MKKTLEEMLSSITCGIRSGIQKSNEVYRKQAQENLRNNISQIHLNMISELFYVFNKGTYTSLAPINNTQCIRPDNWFTKKNDVYFQYRIAKQSAQRTPDIVLQSIKTNMNTDLNTNRHALTFELGLDFYNLFPQLSQGIRVVNVADYGADILVTITTPVMLWG